MSESAPAPQMTPPRSGGELTAVALCSGIILAVVMGAANVYLGLKAGMTVSASIPAAVLASGILGVLFRRRSILEANIVQTSASAGESLAAGIIFTMPALLLTGVWSQFDFWTVSLVALSGGLLGILMMIPMRRAIVVEATELKFPEGLACAEVLRAGAGDEEESAEFGSGTALVFGGLLGGGLVKFTEGYLGLLKSGVSVATRAGSQTWFFGMAVSPALVSVGLIVGLPIAVQVFLGGALGWYVFLPILSAEGYAGDAAKHASEIWSTQVRYVGVGAMVVGGIAAIWKVRGGIRAAFGELKKQFRGRESAAGEVPDTERDLEFSRILALALVCAATVFAIYYVLLGKSISITLLATVAALVLSFFFTAVASYIVGLVGNSNSPVSGMTITAFLATGLCLYVGGYSGATGILAMLGVAGVVCCVACTAGDVCNDLKTGQLVGASPRSQQTAQVLGVVAAAFIMAPVMTMLHEGSAKEGTGGLGTSDYPAPQATLFASLAEGFFGEESEPTDASETDSGDATEKSGTKMPLDLVAWGAGLAVLILLADIPLAMKDTSFRLHVMPVAVGIYLPAEVSVPILLGGIVSALLFRRRKTEGDRAEKRAVLLASGIIAGESLMGVFLGGVVFFGFSVLKLGESAGDAALSSLSLVVLAVVLVLIYGISVRSTGPRHV